MPLPPPSPQTYLASPRPRSHTPLTSRHPPTHPSKQLAPDLFLSSLPSHTPLSPPPPSPPLAQLAPDLLDLLAAGCVVVAAKQVDGPSAAPALPPGADVAGASGLPAAAVEQMEWNVRQVLAQVRGIGSGWLGGGGVC